mmetsp:Transcript_11377/g.18722  ORF Transcript_11377/g.18722 Transcript_11377/m.18722 type:complete len:340 (-) Transcript_11377:2191-3210(-)
MKVLSTYKRISLWLIPPEPILTSLTHTQLQLIELHDKNNNFSSFGLHNSNSSNSNKLPTFIPHVTLVGGIPISECCTVQDDVMPFSKSQNNDNDNGWENRNGNEQDIIDEVAAQSVLRRLACAFGNFGGVECKFVKERGVFAARRMRQEGVVSNNNGRSSHHHDKESGIISNGDGKLNHDDDEGEVQWNQSCISIMERTKTFTQAMELAEQTLFTKTRSSTATIIENECEQQSSTTTSLERHFKPPACEPHYSFVYGNNADLISSLQSSLNNHQSQPISSDNTTISTNNGGKNSFVLECPPNFTSTEIAVVWTYPSSLEGVKHWREIGRFSLVEGMSKY